MNDPHNWKGTKEKSGGGVIIDNGFHMIDTLISFFGDIESVSATAERLIVKAENKEEDTAVISFVFKNNAIADLGLTFAAQHSYFPAGYIGAGIRYDIFGTAGSLHLINGNRFPVSLVKGTKIERWESSELAAKYPLEMNRHFIECLLDGKDPLVTAEDGLKVMRVIDACYESVRTGKKISINA
jgi:predicted dehydrogenase